MAQLSSAWRKNCKSLSEMLQYGLEAGLYSDVGFDVGLEKLRINAHKNFLMLRSEVFEVMFSEKWSTNDSSTLVELPENNPTAFKTFLKFVYTDKLDKEGLSLDILLEVMSLGKMYQFPKLVKDVADELVLILTQPETIVKIYEYTKLLDKEISRYAFDAVKANLCKFIKLEAYLTNGLEGYWNWETWSDILSVEGYDVLEMDLLNAIAKWSQHCETRRKHFDESLRSLIRYPLMGVKVFNEQVVPTGLLNKDDVIHMYLYFTGEDGQFPSKFPFRSRVIVYVSNAIEFRNALEKVEDGGVIQLLAGEYYPGDHPFEVKTNFVTIRGGGESTIMVTEKSITTFAAIEIYGNNCTLDAIKFKGDGMLWILVKGARNKVQNVIMDSVTRGFKIEGHSNLVNNTTWINLNNFIGHETLQGMRIYGDDNIIDGVTSTSTDINCIIQVEGNRNIVRNMQYDSKPCSNIDNRIGVYIKSGKNHVVEHLECKDDYNCDTLLEIGAENASVSNIVSGMEIVVKGKGHRLVKVVAKNKIEVCGNNHHFEVCETDEWEVQQQRIIQETCRFIECGDKVFELRTEIE